MFYVEIKVPTSVFSGGTRPGETGWNSFQRTIGDTVEPRAALVQHQREQRSAGHRQRCFPPSPWALLASGRHNRGSPVGGSTQLKVVRGFLHSDSCYSSLQHESDEWFWAKRNATHRYNRFLRLRLGAWCHLHMAPYGIVWMPAAVGRESSGNMKAWAEKHVVGKCYAPTHFDRQSNTPTHKHMDLYIN